MDDAADETETKRDMRTFYRGIAKYQDELMQDFYRAMVRINNLVGRCERQERN
jgi:hypothetical protein